MTGCRQRVSRAAGYSGCVRRAGTIWGDAMTEKVVWHIVKHYAAKLGLTKVSPHDLRRTCARFCHLAGGELEQIQFLLGHVSVQLSDILAARSDSAKPSMIESGSSLQLDVLWS